MAKAGSAQKTVKKSVASGEKSPKVKLKFTWHEIHEGKRWTTDRIPDGEACTPRVQRTFSPSGVTGKHGYYAYRETRLLGVRDTPEAAMVLAESGRRDADTDNVSFYVGNSPGEIPPFLCLTAEERRAVRSTYSYAAPSQIKVEAAERRAGGRVDARNLADPSTAKFLEQLEKKIASAPVPSDARPARKPGASAGTTKVERAGVELPDDGVLARLRQGNPKKEGSAAHKRWVLMFEHCDKGSSVKEFLAAGGNPETLRNACLKGWAKVEVK